MSVNCNLFLWVCLSVLSKFLFFPRFSNSGSFTTEPRSLSKQCMKNQCPRKRKEKSFDPELIGGSTRLRRRGGGCCCSLSWLICPPSWFQVRKAGLGATLKNGSKWPFSGNFSDEEGGGGGRTRHPPSKTANETCDECLCGKFSPPRSTKIIIYRQISTCRSSSQWVDAAWYTGSTSK